MAVVFSQDIIEVAINAEVAGQPHVNVLHLFNDETGGTDVTKVEDLRNNWQDHIMLMLDAAYVLQDFTWRSLDPDDLNQGIVIPDPAKRLTGASTGTALPPNNAYLVKKITQGRQRGQRDGRMFIGGVKSSQVFEDGLIAAAEQTNWAAALDSFLSGVNDSGFTLGSGSYLAVLNAPPESREPGTQSVTVSHRPVTDLVIDPKISTQRDRLR
jgi:hypothetical protein